MQLPKPLANRDFLTARAWKVQGKEMFIVNHSVNHAVNELICFKDPFLIFIILATCLHNSQWNDFILSHIINFDIHKYSLLHTQSVPLRKSYIRGTSYMTGYYLVSDHDDTSQDGCTITYVTHSDPKGAHQLLLHIVTTTT